MTGEETSPSSAGAGEAGRAGRFAAEGRVEPPAGSALGWWEGWAVGVACSPTSRVKAQAGEETKALFFSLRGMHRGKQRRGWNQDLLPRGTHRSTCPPLNPRGPPLLPGPWPPGDSSLTGIFDRFHQDSEVLFVRTQARGDIFNPPEILLYLRFLLRNTSGSSLPPQPLTRRFSTGLALSFQTGPLTLGGQRFLGNSPCPQSPGGRAQPAPWLHGEAQT